jgi:hypothetical protein
LCLWHIQCFSHNHHFSCIYCLFPGYLEKWHIKVTSRRTEKISWYLMYFSWHQMQTCMPVVYIYPPSAVSYTGHVFLGMFAFSWKVNKLLIFLLENILLHYNYPS